VFRIALIAGLCCSALALAQTRNPEDDWGAFPVDPDAPPPPPPPPTLPPPPPPTLPVWAPAPAPGRGATAGRGGISGKPRVPDEPNRVSVYGAPTLGQWNRGQALFLGFPLLGVRLAIGLLDRLDFSVGFESFYGAMNEFSAQVKVGIFHADHWSMAASMEGMLALFTQGSVKEGRGPRWITGHRNYGLSPGVVFSYQGDSPRAARLFLELRYLMSFDTEPFAEVPLSGAHPGLVIGHNVLAHFGAEIPVSAKTSFFFALGMDFHGRSTDSVVMPVASLGLVTGI
jgi:hypothetical protein